MSKALTVTGSVENQKPDYPNLVSLKWRGTAKRCVTCHKETHLWWTQRYSSSGFLDVGYALCQGDSKRRGGIYLSILELFFARRKRLADQVVAEVGV